MVWGPTLSLSVGASCMGRWATLRKVMVGQRPTPGVPFSPQPHMGSSPIQGGHRQVPPGALQSALPLPVWLGLTPFLDHVLSRAPWSLTRALEPSCLHPRPT